MPTRSILALALAGVAAASSLAFAADAPKTSSTNKPLFLSQQCSGAKAPVLEEKPQDDDGRCGYVAGLPLGELDYTIDKSQDFIDFPTLPSFPQQSLDITKKVTGQIAMTAWFGDLPGGAGTISIDVKGVGLLANGKTIQFGTTTASAPASMSSQTVDVPFALAIPGTAGGSKLKSFVLSVNPRGQNFNMSAMELGGESWMALPLKGKK